MGRDPAGFLDGSFFDRNVVLPPAEQFDIHAIGGMSIVIVCDTSECTALIEWAIQNDFIRTPEPAV